jgi:putative serine protease PepD
MVAVRPLRTPTVTLAAALAAGALIGAGGGAATYAALSTGNGSTVVRQVTVSDAQPASSDGNLSVQSIYQLANKGVVEVTAGQGQGSGFVYDADGHIITNEHVVDGANSVSVRFWNGKTFTASVVGTDASTDLAVLKVDAPVSQLFPLSLGDSSKLVVGDQVVAIGSPFGLEGTVTSGIVSALHREMTSPNHFAIDNSIQTDAAINHGNSGGPLLNAQGKVVGVNSQIESNSGGNEGVGFALPSNTVKSIASQLISNGAARHAYLGVELGDSGTSARVVSVRTSTPASKAGLRAGDVITAIGGSHISSSDELRAAINARKPGDRVSVTYTRNGTKHTVSLTLASRPS